MDSKPNDSEKSLPSNELAKELISNLNSESKNKTYSTSQLLEIYKTKKHPNYEKFSQYIEKQLSSFQKDIYQILDNLIYLGKKMQEADNSEAQRKSIVTGYKKFIFKFLDKENLMPKGRKDLIDYLVKNYFQFDKSINPFICELICCSFDKIPEANRQFYEKQMHSEVVDVVRFRKMKSDEAEKCCLIIHYMDLYKYFKTQDLAYIAQQNSSQNISYFFVNKKGQQIHQLIQTYMVKLLPHNEGKVKKLVTALKLNPFEYKQLIRTLSKKSLRYFISNQPIYALDSKLTNRPDIAEYMVEILIDQKRFKEALHFINKHYLTQFYHLNSTSDRSYNKNILEKFDQFQPTQHILASRIPSYSKIQYLKLSDLKYQQSNVKFITKQTLSPDILTRIFNSPRFGIDCESSPVFNEYQQATTQIAQIAVDYKQYDVEEERQKHIKQIYIIDLVGMSKSQIFTQWLRKMCVEYQGIIVGHTVKKDFQEFVAEVLAEEDVKIGELNFFDIAVEFKNKYKQTKSSLEYICKCVLQRNLSKFEQCSGWNNRPLRKAQLHYAALDAALTLVIYSKL